MPFVSRIGDTNAGGGKVLTGAPTVLVAGRPAAQLFSAISPHWKKHYVSSVSSASPRVLAGGKPVARITSSNTCGHPLITGCTNVIVP